MGLLVNEIFYSIQGESSCAGRPCVMVRLTGCNLRCTYCDTRYAYTGGLELSFSEIVGEVRRHRCRLVEVTGGEPLIQEQTPALIRQLLDLDFEVLLETNGSVDVSNVDIRCVKIVDVKCPSSGESGRMDLENLARLARLDELKFVIADEQDYAYAKEVLNLARSRAGWKISSLFSPVFGELAPRTLAEWILSDHLDVRFQLQLHKIIWGPDERGV